MVGETDLDRLLNGMQPTLLAEDYVFCSLGSACYGDYAELAPLASFQEEEGLTLVLPRKSADLAGFTYASVFRAITLQVHSSLDAVGLTAEVAAKLAEQGISANVIAAYYHDHIFVPSGREEEAMTALNELSFARNINKA